MSTLGCILPFCYYAGTTIAIIPQSTMHHSGKDLSAPAEVEVEVTHVATTLDDGTPKTTGMAVWVK